MNKLKKWILIRRINKALGFKLYDWQVNYIFQPLPWGAYLNCMGRYHGITTAQILRIFFSPTYEGVTHIVRPCSVNKSGVSDYEKQYLYDIFGADAVSLPRQQHFIDTAREIATKLFDSNIFIAEDINSIKLFSSSADVPGGILCDE